MGKSLWFPVFRFSLKPTNPLTTDIFGWCFLHGISPISPGHCCTDWSKQDGPSEASGGNRAVLALRHLAETSILEMVIDLLAYLIHTHMYVYIYILDDLGVPLF